MRRLLTQARALPTMHPICLALQHSQCAAPQCSAASLPRAEGTHFPWPASCIHGARRAPTCHVCACVCNNSVEPARTPPFAAQALFVHALVFCASVAVQKSTRAAFHRRQPWLQHENGSGCRDTSQQDSVPTKGAACGEHPSPRVDAAGTLGMQQVGGLQPSCQGGRTTRQPQPLSPPGRANPAAILAGAVAEAAAAATGPACRDSTSSSRPSGIVKGADPEQQGVAKPPRPAGGYRPLRAPRPTKQGPPAYSLADPTVHKALLLAVLTRRRRLSPAHSSGQAAAGAYSKGGVGALQEACRVRGGRACRQHHVNVCTV